jgi:hypothetical protein
MRAGTLTAKKLVIDGDVLLYRFAFANQTKVRWDEDTVSEVIQPFEIAADEMERFLVRLLKHVDCDDYLIALRHATYFRFRLGGN